MWNVEFGIWFVKKEVLTGIVLVVALLFALYEAVGAVPELFIFVVALVVLWDVVSVVNEVQLDVCTLP